MNLFNLLKNFIRYTQLRLNTSKLQVGQEVEHERFGFGKVINLEGNKPDIKATVFIKEIGQKQLLLKFAKLRIVEP